jgi:hypothetical protein
MVPYIPGEGMTVLKRMVENQGESQYTDTDQRKILEVGKWLPFHDHLLIESCNKGFYPVIKPFTVRGYSISYTVGGCAVCSIPF